MARRGRAGLSEAIAIQRAAQMAGRPTAGFFGDIFGKIKSTVGGFISGGPVGAIGGFLSPGATPQAMPFQPIFMSGQQPGARASCSPGFRVNPATGICEQIGFRGAVERTLPGGQAGTMADVFGEAVLGAFGMPALVPAQVGTINGGPILRCPLGAVLGKDNLCYQKGNIPIKFRKWRPSRKPPISAKRWAELKGTATTKRMAKEIAAAAGFSCRRK